MIKRLLLVAMLAILPMSAEANISSNPINTLLTGTTAQRPVQPVEGNIRDNTTLHAVEVYLNGAWSSIQAGLVNLASGVTGTLGVASGGTGATTAPLALFNLYGSPSAGGQWVTSTGSTTVVQPSVNVVGTCNALDFDPNILTETGTTLQASIQNFLLNCMVQSISNNQTENYADVTQWPYIRAVFPSGFQMKVQSSIVVPPYVALSGETYFIRNGTVGTATANCGGAATANTLANKECPVVVFSPTSANVGDLIVNANSNGTDNGSAVGTNAWEIQSLAIASGGSGFVGGETCTTASSMTKAPYNGASFTCSTASGGACTALTFAGSEYSSGSGVYPLPPALMSQLFTSAAWSAIGQSNQYAANGSDLTTSCSGVGNGLVVTPTWRNDWTTGSTTYHGIFEATTSAEPHWYGNIRVFNGANINDSTYGPTFGILFGFIETSFNYLYTQNERYGIYFPAADLRGNILNDVGSAVELKIRSGGNRRIGMAMLDTPTDSVTNTGHCFELDNAQGTFIDNLTCFHNTNTATDLSTNQLQIGQTGASSSTQESSGVINAYLSSASSTASALTALAINYANDFTINLTVDNLNGSGSANTAQYTNLVNFTGSNAANSTVNGQWSNQSGNGVTGTQPASVHVRTNSAKDGVVYENNVIDFMGQIGVGTSAPTGGLDVDVGTSSALVPLNINPANNQSKAFTSKGVATMDVGSSSQTALSIFGRTGQSVPIFEVGTLTGSQGNALSVGSSGSVGIGTITPLATLDVRGTIKTGGYSVAALPTGSVGMRAYVTDQLTACVVAGAALTGGGAVTCPVFYNGSAWVGD